jgi:DNA-binding LacI/PurR family transcriptional regulator
MLIGRIDGDGGRWTTEEPILVPAQLVIRQSTRRR